MGCDRFFLGDFQCEQAAGLVDDLGDGDPAGVGGLGCAFEDDDAVFLAFAVGEFAGDAGGKGGFGERVAVEEDAVGGDRDFEVLGLVGLFRFGFGAGQALVVAVLWLDGGADEEEDDENERDVRAGAARGIDEELAAFEFHVRGGLGGRVGTGCPHDGTHRRLQAMADRQGVLLTVRFHSYSRASVCW